MIYLEVFAEYLTDARLEVNLNMSFSLKSVPQDDREVEYRDTPFPSLFDAILGRLGMMTKGADDDWVDDYISKQQNRESGYSISVTAGADGEEDDDDDDDDVEYLDKETNIALAMYDVLSSPASVKAEQDAAEAISKRSKQGQSILCHLSRSCK